MGRANRLTVTGGIFHVTHRCHNKAFLLIFAKDRNSYRQKLREGLAEFSVSLLDCVVTSNHVHLLVEASDKRQLSGFMRKVSGEFARQFNRRNHRANAFWGDNFHATLVESGTYLFRCLLYLEMNMVRCGAVLHPRQWEWVGYHEIMGRRQRYRLIDLDRLCWRMGTNDPEELRRNIEHGLNERIRCRHFQREAFWTQALGVGSRQFLEQTQAMIFTRLETRIEDATESICVLKEEPIPYHYKRLGKSGSNAEFSQLNCRK
jgi:putative transposase